MRKNIYCTLDTETLNGAAQNEVGAIYDLGYVIHDKEGNVFATGSFLVMENYEQIRNNAFYGKKNFPLYAERIACGHTSAVATVAEGVELIRNICKFYNVKYVMAYNSGFDFGRTDCKALLDDFEFIDIMYAFYDTVAKQKKYNKYCCENGFITKSGNIRMTAEIAYRFCSKDFDFEEEHTALSDAMIEMQIFVSCVKTHKKYTKNEHKGNYYKKVIKAKY